MDAQGDPKRRGIDSRLAKLSSSKQALLKSLVSGGRDALLHGPDASRAGGVLGGRGPSAAPGRHHAPRGRDAGPSPLVVIQPGARGRIFFGLHALSGTVTIYTGLGRSLGESQPFYALQARGVAAEEEPYTSLEAMAAYYLEAIREAQPEGPYMLGGYSLGGHVAYEVAQQLQAQGAEVGLLALLDSPRDAFKINWVGEFDDALFWRWRFKNYVTLSTEHLRGLDAEGQVSYVIERLRVAEVQPACMQLPDDGVRRLLTVEKANCLALFKYRHKPYRGRITLLSAEQGPGSTGPREMGWAPLALGGLDIHVVPGNHKSMIESPHVEFTGRVLTECIARHTEAAV